MTRKPAAVLLVLSAAVTALALLPATGLAAKGSGGGGKPSGGGSKSGSSSLNPELVNDLNGNGSPNYGDTLTFHPSTTATAQPYVDVACSQNGKPVYGQSAGFFPG